MDLQDKCELKDSIGVSILDFYSWPRQFIINKYNLKHENDVNTNFVIS